MIWISFTRGLTSLGNPARYAATAVVYAVVFKENYDDIQPTLAVSGKDLLTFYTCKTSANHISTSADGTLTMHPQCKAESKCSFEFTVVVYMHGVNRAKGHLVSFGNSICGSQRS